MVNKQCERILKKFKEIDEYKNYSVVWGGWIISDSIDGTIDSIKDNDQRLRYYDFMKRRDEPNSFYNWALNLFDDEPSTYLSEKVGNIHIPFSLSLLRRVFLIYSHQTLY